MTQPHLHSTHTCCLPADDAHIFPFFPVCSGERNACAGSNVNAGANVQSRPVCVACEKEFGSIFCFSSFKSHLATPAG